MGYDNDRELFAQLGDELLDAAGGAGDDIRGGPEASAAHRR